MTRRFGLALVSALLLSLAGCGEQLGESDAVEDWATAGCSLDVPTIEENQEFVSPDEQFGNPGPPPPIKAGPVDPEVVRAVPAGPEVDGKRARGMAKDGDRLTVYYADSDPSGKEESTFYREGGLALTQHKLGKEETSVVESMRQLVPERITEFTLGESDAVLSWDDPQDDSGVRAHRVSWSANGKDYTFGAVREADELIVLARTMVCK